MSRLIEFLGRDGREARIVAGGADGGVVQRLAQRGRGAEETAAGAELPATLEADEAAVDGRVGDFAQDGGHGRGGLRLHGGRHAPARRPEHPLLLLLAEDGAPAGTHGQGRLGDDLADADGHAAAAPVARPLVEPAGNRPVAVRAAAFTDVIGAQDIAVALDHGPAAAGTISRLAFAVADVAGVDVAQAAAAGDVVGRQRASPAASARGPTA